MKLTAVTICAYHSKYQALRHSLNWRFNLMGHAQCCFFFLFLIWTHVAFLPGKFVHSHSYKHTHTHTSAQWTWYFDQFRLPSRRSNCKNWCDCTKNVCAIKECSNRKTHSLIIHGHFDIVHVRRIIFWMQWYLLPSMQSGERVCVLSRLKVLTFWIEENCTTMYTLIWMIRKFLCWFVQMSEECGNVGSAELQPISICLSFRFSQAD